MKTLKKFNKTIKVEVSMDSIAQQLLATFKEDNPHRVLLTETIIGTLDNEDRMTDLYNSLNGYTNEIDFEIGQQVVSKDTYYNGAERVEIGQCTIADIDAYKKRYKVRIEYTRNGSDNPSYDWVDHTNLTNYVPDELIVEDLTGVETVRINQLMRNHHLKLNETILIFTELGYKVEARPSVKVSTTLAKMFDDFISSHEVDSQIASVETNEHLEQS